MRYALAGSFAGILFIVVVMAAAAPAGAAGTASSAAAMPAVGVLASASGQVSVDRPGSASPLPGTLGMRLLPGDTVRVAAASSATVYLAGGGLVRVPAGSRIEIPKEAGPAADPSLSAAMSSRSVAVLEAGLWILNDPEGSVLLSAMRGEGDDWGDGHDAGPQPLSPRYETVLEARPRFVWNADGEAHVVIARGKEIVWRSPPAAGGALTFPAGAPDLRQGEVYRWWLETPGGNAPSESVPFRLAEKKALADADRFEKEVVGLAGADDGATLSSLLRCGYYVEVGAWTRVLAAAADLRRHDPSSAAAERALDGSRRQMRLGEEAAARLAALSTAAR